MPETVEKEWALATATPMLKYASFMPITRKSVRTLGHDKGHPGRRDRAAHPQTAVSFVVDELSNELGKELIVRD